MGIFFKDINLIYHEKGKNREKKGNSRQRVFRPRDRSDD